MNKVMTALATLTSSTNGANDKVAIEKVRSVLISFEAELRAKLEAKYAENDNF